MFEKSLYRKARGQMAVGNEKKGLELLEKLMEKKKVNIDMKVFYAFYLMKNGDFKKARQVFDRLILPFDEHIEKSAKATKVQVKQNHALLLWKEGNLEEAIKITEEIIKNYKNTVVYGNLGYFYVLAKSEKALEFNLEAYDFASDDAVILDNLGFSYYIAGNLEKAEEMYEKIHSGKKEPAFPEAYYNYGLVALKKGDKEKAKELFEKALLQKFSYLSDLDKETVEKALEEL